jgi:hypothetical protein
VIGYISQTFPKFVRLPTNEFIRRAYAASLLHPDSYEVATILSLLALSLSAGSQLTPGVQVPSPKYKQRLLKWGVDELGTNILSDPNFEALLVVEVAGMRLLRSLKIMISTVRELVGTMDFGEVSYTAVDGNTSATVV